MRLKRIRGKVAKHRTRKRMTKTKRQEATLFDSLYRNIVLSSRGKGTYSMAVVDLLSRVH